SDQWGPPHTLRTAKTMAELGCKLVFILREMRACLEARALERIEDQLAKLGGHTERRNGYLPTNLPSARGHCRDNRQAGSAEGAALRGAPAFRWRGRGGVFRSLPCRSPRPSRACGA